MRRLTLASLLLIGSQLASAQSATPDLSQKLTIDAKVSSLTAILAQVSEKAGYLFTANPEVAEDRLVVRVKDYALQSLLNNVASVTRSKWDKRESGWVLIPDRAYQQKYDAEVLAIRLQNLREQVRMQLEQYTKPTPPPNGPEDPSMTPDELKEWQEMMRQEQMSNPENRFLLECLSKMDLRPVAAMRNDQRIVFAGTPTRMQVFSGAIDPLVGALSQAYNAQAKIDEERRKNEPPSEEPEVPEFMRGMIGGQERQRVALKEAVAKCIVSFQGTDFTMSTSTGSSLVNAVLATITAFDRKGNIVITHSTQFTVDRARFNFGMIEAGEAMATVSDEPNSEVPKPNPKPNPKSQPPHPVIAQLSDEKMEWDELSKELQKVANMNDPMSMVNSKLSPELTAAMLVPTKIDPLHWSIGQVWQRVATVKNWQLVGNLSDDVNFFSTDAQAGLKRLIAPLVADQSSTVDVKDGVLTITPVDPRRLREERIDRQALEKLVGVCQKTAVPGIQDIAAYAAVNPSPMTTAMVMPYMMTVAGGVLSTEMLMGGNNWLTLRFFGSLGVSQRDTLLSGGKVSFSQLSGAQIRNLNVIVFGPSNDIKTSEDKEPEFMPFMFGMMDRGNRKSYVNEPTELLPTGLPPDGFVQLKSEDGDMVTLAGNGAGFGRMFGAFGADELAFFQMMMDSPEAAQAMGGMTFDKFKVGARTKMTFFFNLAPNVFVRSKVNHDRMASDAKVVTFNELPQRLRDEVKKRRDALKSFEDMMKRGSGERSDP